MTEPPCIGLHPDTDPCPFCGAAASDPCAYDVNQRGYQQDKLLVERIFNLHTPEEPVCPTP